VKLHEKINELNERSAYLISLRWLPECFFQHIELWRKECFNQTLSRKRRFTEKRIKLKYDCS